MKLLPKRFGKNNLCYQQVQRTSKVAMYSTHIEPEGEPVAYEVFLVRIGEANTKVLGGKKIHFQAHERLPSNEEFGRIAWSWLTREQADRAYKRLLDGKDPVTGRSDALIRRYVDFSVLLAGAPKATEVSGDGQ